MKGIFRSLRNHNYRIWASGALVSNVGTWMQRAAQYWLVLAQLTHHDATAVAAVMSLQTGPLVLLLPISGFTVDHFDRRKVLIVTQATMGVFALLLGALTVTGVVRLWHVYALALLLGCATAFDSPARHTFVSDLVGEADLSNAVALNSTSFNAARMLGPAAAGMLIAAVGSGWVFVINGLSFVAVLCSLCLLRTGELRRADTHEASRGSVLEGLRYVRRHPHIKAVFLMLFLIGTFGANFPIYISTMSVVVFHLGASRYGLLTSMMAVGSITGALLAARRETPHAAHLLISAISFGLGCAAAALAPSFPLFGVALVGIGASAQTFLTTTNSFVQLSTEPSMRGRVMALYLAITLGGTPVGAPIVGWVADFFGPRWALCVGAVSGLAAGLVAARHPPLIRPKSPQDSFESRAV